MMLRRRMIVGVLRGLVLTVCVTVLGCGGKSDGEGATTLDTGLPPEKRLVDLAGDEATQLCMVASSATADYFDDFYSLEALCTAYAIGMSLQTTTTDQALQSSCATARTNCLANPPQAVLDRQMSAPQIEMQECVNPPMFLPACMATVGQYEQCATVTYAEGRRFAAPLMTCNTTRAAVEGATMEGASDSLTAMLRARPECAALEPCDSDPTTAAIPPLMR